MKSTCPRLFEVEAARDGRLTGSDLARFRRHLAHCVACADEARALDSLADSLRSLPAVTDDDLHVRRERTRLLAAFDARLVPAPSTAKRWLVPLVAAAFLTTLSLTLWHSHQPSSSAAHPAPAPPREAISIQPALATHWSRQVESHRETIILTSGSLAISIDHTLSPRRLRVVLPDGELEDLGTTFTVTASSSTTTHVSVQEGSVILRLRDRPPILLNADQSWSFDTAPAAQPMLHAPPPAAPAAAPALPLAPARASAPTPPRAAPTDAAPATNDSATDFRAALSALNAGESALAATLFSEFLTRHPTAANAEDAAYLRIIALQRAGSTSAMAAAARDYLARYPSAFRRAEVEPLAR